MRMRRLIWVAGSKGLIIPKVFSKFPHSDPPKLGSLVFVKILTNAALFLNIFGYSLGPKKTPVAPFTVRARNMGLNKGPYEKVPDSLV